MTDNVLLYNGPSKDYVNKNVVTMNRTDSQLRFDIILRHPGNTVFNRIVLKKLPSGALSVFYGPTGELPYIQKPFDIVAAINEHVLDSSAHFFVQSSIMEFLNQFIPVNPFELLANPVDTILHAMHPMTTLIPTNHYATVEQFKVRREYLAAIRQSSVQDMAVTLFGQKRYRKDLVKALANANSLEFLAFMMTLKREVPIDWFINILRANPEVGFLPHNYDHDKLVTFYNQMTDKQFRRFCKLLETEKFLPLQSIVDTAYQYDECLKEMDHGGDEALKVKFKSLEDFHYRIGQVYRVTENERIKRKDIEEKSGPVGDHPIYDVIRNLDLENAPYEIVIPEDAYELVEWGSEIKHCIWSYTGSAKSGEAAFLGFYQDGKLIGNYHFNSDSGGVQFRGYENCMMPKNVHLDFNLRMICAGVFTHHYNTVHGSYKAVFEATGRDKFEDIKADFDSLGVSVSDFVSSYVKV